jgi:hypothetical protein
MAEIPKPHPREVEDGYVLYGSSPSEIARWARESRPPIDVADVAARVRRLRDAGILSAEDEEQVERLLPE